MTDFIWPESCQQLRDTSVYPDTFDPIDDSRTSSLGFHLDHHDSAYVREFNERIAGLLEQRAALLCELFEKLHPGVGSVQFAWPQSVETLVRADLEPDTFAPIVNVNRTSLGLDLTDPLATAIFNVSQLIAQVWSRRNRVIENAIAQYAQTKADVSRIHSSVDHLYAPASMSVNELIKAGTEKCGQVTGVAPVTNPTMNQHVEFEPLSAPSSIPGSASQHANPMAPTGPADSSVSPAIQCGAQTSTQPIQVSQPLAVQPVQVPIDAAQHMPVQQMAGQRTPVPQVTAQRLSVSSGTAPAVPMPQAVRQSERKAANTQSVVLYTGVILVALSAIAFVSIAFQFMNDAARSITLGAIGFLFLVLAYSLRKKLHATAQGLTWLAFAIGLIDIIYMSAVSVIPHYGTQHFTAIALALLAGLGWTVEKITAQGKTGEGKPAQLSAGRWVWIVLSVPVVFSVPFMLPVARNIQFYFAYILVAALIGAIRAGHMDKDKQFTRVKWIWLVSSLVAMVSLLVPGSGFTISNFEAADYITPLVALAYWCASLRLPRRGRKKIKELGIGLDIMSLAVFVFPYIARTYHATSFVWMDVLVLCGAAAGFGVWILDRHIKDGELEYRGRTFILGYTVVMSAVIVVRVISTFNGGLHRGNPLYDASALIIALMTLIPAALWALTSYMGVKGTEHVAVALAFIALYLAAYGARFTIFTIITIVLAAIFLGVCVATRQQYARVLNREKNLPRYAQIQVTWRILTVLSLIIAYCVYVSFAQSIHTDGADRIIAIICGIVLAIEIITSRVVLSQGMRKPLTVIMTVFGYCAAAYVVSVADMLLTTAPYCGLILATAAYVIVLYGATKVDAAKIHESAVTYHFDSVEMVILLELTGAHVLWLMVTNSHAKQYAGIAYAVMLIASAVYWITGRARKDIMISGSTKYIGHISAVNTTVVASLAVLSNCQPTQFPDIYTLTAGALLTLCGVYYLAWNSRLRTNRALGWGFAFILIPGFIWSLIEQGSLQSFRDVIMVIILIALAVWGGMKKWRAPLLTGTIGVIAFTVMRTWVIISRVVSQYWFATLFVAGVGLILLAVFFESVKSWSVKLWQMR